MAHRPERQLSAYSLPERRTDDPALDDIDDGASDTSSRSDQSEEAAGLVSRLSDEQDRASRRAKYEGSGGGARLGIQAALKLSSGPRGESEDGSGSSRAGDLEHGAPGHGRAIANADGTPVEREHSIAPSDVRDGVFRDRSADAGGASTTRKRRIKRRQDEQGLFVRTWKIAREALPTLLLSLCSLVLSGELLVHLAKWPVFSKVDKLFILIPILLNLKGNLEGNLSLRMSTSANIGELDIRRTRETLIFGNMALLQVQALIVSLFAGILSFILGLGTAKGKSEGAKSPPAMAVRHSRLTPRRVIHHHPSKLDPALKLRNTYFEFVLVIATAMLSASLSSIILGTFMCALVVVTRQLGGNPDNIASPLAGSLGDLLTLSLLGFLSSFLVRFEGTVLATLILVALAVSCVVCFMAAYRNAYVRELLSSGWVPLLVAMLVSSVAGLVLDAFVQKFEGFALLVPVMTGLPGAITAIFVSRTSTALHGGAGNNFKKPRSLKHAPHQSAFQRIWSTVYDWFAAIGGPAEGWTVPLTMFALGMLVTLAFVAFTLLSGQMTFGAPFFIMLMLSSTVTFACSLAVAHAFSILLWRYDYDPDIYCLPYATSIVDLVGQLLLVLAYYIAIAMGDEIQATVNDELGK